MCKELLLAGSVMTPKAWGWKGGIAALVWAFRCQVLGHGDSDLVVMSSADSRLFIHEQLGFLC
ncbi:uncharacterized protein PHALS_12082 [Plasmopara halstedii]|uniref:Uncharacterized protein n=1 Tax=Plasmopara halstedii TaxID=4781 RepID=A0A0P1ALA3_PLAHL|nr:uncharacterized protein PHALS_12082 [Plasmopara halstedii]CEG41753.1 hypothetical protein PHALS_12082 [Plasmopara halstedii]|eukprot:XP_024578122.1 hypothetical protein PHALS_12082 [Plasmopara halstedii]